MQIAVTGSIATDHLMNFPGRFSEQLLADRLDKVSLSFLADDLEVRRGGVAANIAIGLGRLGIRPLLVGAAGVDFAEYGKWLEANGVDTTPVRVSETRHTARFVCTTDADQNQIATFYPGAMSEAREIELGPIAGRAGGLDLVLIGANDPDAMLRHTQECRCLGIAFAADPSQQLATLDGPSARQLVTGARYLFTNDYEASLLQERTGWTAQQVLDRVGTWITTLGADGVRIDRTGEPTISVPAVLTTAPSEPTGVGDAFRAGFLAGAAWKWTAERSAQLGCALATIVLESVGPQEYQLSAADLLGRIDSTHGGVVAGEIEPHLAAVS
ncbi:carbohydrate kinase family protein [Streptomyces sp. H10-C2]|uniref:carbohydrate kinase family protein n=1 Tax=unclassified Streptomyces TaxID=2593676 RepID=UPI0024BB29F7|nr:MULTISPECIES: carbohydrate kinase family protein [unclassified Streptomyces]MDJ0345979.1 carbohydrate kinase family protein [Streptomyces sp. PH10-H1]MDJ0370514.1 carbohydrate kinase family protein [Streptomyces sp. H10-C2]